MKAAAARSGITRREFLGLAGLGTGAMVFGACGGSTAEKRGTSSSASGGNAVARVVGYDLEASPVDVELDGRIVSTWGYNGSVGGPELRLREGDTLRVALHNRLPQDTTIHWHGQPIVNEMDGVPNVTQPPIGSGESFTYEFTVPASGTYFYHPHVGLQLDRGLYGPLIVEPKNEPLSYDREFVLMLDDWLDGIKGTPEDEMKKLKSGGSAMADMTGEMGGMQGMSGMKDTDGGRTSSQVPPDVIYPYYIINGRPSGDPEELRVKRGEKVRLRFINPSGATIYRVALAGHKMTVTHADGGIVEPVEVDALRIGMGERYDVLVEATNPGVWQLAAQAKGTRRRMARALFRYEGSSASAPPADHEPTELGRKMLHYGMLEAGEPDGRLGGDPDRVVPVELSGDEDSYVWKMDGEVFSEADPIATAKDRHVRFAFTNKTMMPHPMHLHGHFFRVGNGTPKGLMKDTVIVEPKQELAIDWYSDNPGDWAFHCHTVYHQEAGMMRMVEVA